MVAVSSGECQRPLAADCGVLAGLGQSRLEGRDVRLCDEGRDGSLEGAPPAWRGRSAEFEARNDRIGLPFAHSPRLVDAVLLLIGRRVTGGGVGGDGVLVRVEQVLAGSRAEKGQELLDGVL